MAVGRWVGCRYTRCLFIFIFFFAFNRKPFNLFSFFVFFLGFFFHTVIIVVLFKIVLKTSRRETACSLPNMWDRGNDKTTRRTTHRKRTICSLDGKREHPGRHFRCFWRVRRRVVYRPMSCCGVFFFYLHKKPSTEWEGPAVQRGYNFSGVNCWRQNAAHQGQIRG